MGDGFVRECVVCSRDNRQMMRWEGRRRLNKQDDEGKDRWEQGGDIKTRIHDIDKQTRKALRSPTRLSYENTLQDAVSRDVILRIDGLCG